MEYITTKEAAIKWNITDRRVRILCSEGKIAGARQVGRTWLIPSDANKPIDERIARYKRQTIIKKNISIFEQIDKKKQILDSLRPLTAGELVRLREEFLIEFTYNSNAIEGNTLTLQETAMVLEGITIDKKPLKDHFEVIGHKDAFLYILQLVQEKVPLSERVIKEIHSLVLMNRPEDRGRYRRIPVRIMGANYEPPQPYLVPVQMEQLIEKHNNMKSTMHVVESVAAFHLLFEGVHPFIDGNGRTGRLLINLELLQHGFPAINVKFTDRKRYYSCFNSFYDTGNSQEMTSLISEYVEEMLDKYLEIL